MVVGGLVVVVCSELATIFDDDLLTGLALFTADFFNRLDNIHPIDDFSKHHVLAIQPETRRIKLRKPEGQEGGGIQPFNNIKPA